MADYNKLQADRPVGKRITAAKARAIVEAVFTKIMPEQGFAVRDEQVALAEHILKTLVTRGTTAAEAAVGIGKSHAAIVPALVVKRGRINDSYGQGLYPETPYSKINGMPVAIATSSKALQKSLLTDYIPKLSKILMASGVITTPITAILYKGRDNYICRRRLKNIKSFINDQSERQKLEEVYDSDCYDLAELEATAKTKRQIAVSGRCFDTCPHYHDCPYNSFMTSSRIAEVDFLIINHNYAAIDSRRRAEGQQSLIPDYQAIFYDESHKYLSAARSTYGVELSEGTANDLLNQICDINFRRPTIEATTVRSAKRLADKSEKLFALLTEEVESQDSDNESGAIGIKVDVNMIRHLSSVRDYSQRLIMLLQAEALYIKANELLAWANQKYGANTKGIDLRSLLANFATDDNALALQINSIYRKICNLPEIERRVKKEQSNNRCELSFYSVERSSKILNNIWSQARKLIRSGTPLGEKSERLIRLIRQITQFQESVSELAKYDKNICWLESDKDGNRLCAIPKDLGKRLYEDQWSKRIPTVLMSGTLSAAGGFTHVRNSLGLNHLNDRFWSETTHLSPFDYRKNSLLYIPKHIPRPDLKSQLYINAVANEIEKLIIASHGHAAVLFTSYKVMDFVWEKLQRKLPFPLFRLGKNGIGEIEKFKKSNGGVIFASGSMWEGIDIPGDALSMLIIVKLPFAVPDPISEHEKTLYPNFQTYFNSVTFPEMLVKLKQGHGRLIRTENDTGCVAILDCRYCEQVLSALPSCRITSDIKAISEFMTLNKSINYFDPDFKI
jgi:Rad3-related DNA helicase